MAEAELLILVADDHPLVRGALREAVLGQLPDAKVLEAGGFYLISQTLKDKGDLGFFLPALHIPGTHKIFVPMYFWGR